MGGAVGLTTDASAFSIAATVAEKFGTKGVVWSMVAASKAAMPRPTPPTVGLVMPCATECASGPGTTKASRPSSVSRTTGSAAAEGAAVACAKSERETTSAAAASAPPQTKSRRFVVARAACAASFAMACTPLSVSEMGTVGAVRAPMAELCVPRRRHG